MNAQRRRSVTSSLVPPRDPPTDSDPQAGGGASPDYPGERPRPTMLCGCWNAVNTHPGLDLRGDTAVTLMVD